MQWECSERNEPSTPEAVDHGSPHLSEAPRPAPGRAGCASTCKSASQLRAIPRPGPGESPEPTHDSVVGIRTRSPEWETAGRGQLAQEGRVAFGKSPPKGLRVAVCWGLHVERIDLPSSILHSHCDFPTSPDKAVLWRLRPQRRLTAGNGLLREGPSPWAGVITPAAQQGAHSRWGSALASAAGASCPCGPCRLQLPPPDASPAAPSLSVPSALAWLPVEFMGRAPLWGGGGQNGVTVPA